MNVEIDDLMLIIAELEVTRRVLVRRIAELEKAQVEAAPETD